jgi:sterol desaturase/sphingolipid hydroxylase (fatty acid hydroxylase superfamily)
MLDRIAGAALGFVALAGVYVALERAFPARPEERFPGPAWRTDACFFFGQYLLFSTAAIWLLTRFHWGLDRSVPDGLRAGFRALPIALGAVIAVVLGDVLVYWFHRACHRFELLWRFHAVHHGSPQLDWLAAHREHPVDGILTQLCQNLPAMVLGLPFEVLAVLIAFRGAWSILLHANVSLPLGALRFVLGAPELHHWHHASLERTEHNFGNLAPWLDVVFGTYHRPHGPENWAIGVTEPLPRGYLAQLLSPLLPARAARVLFSPASSSAPAHSCDRTDRPTAPACVR